MSVGENALRALRRLGHDVHYVDNTGHFPVLQAIRHSADPPAVKQRMLEGFLDQLRQQTRQATLSARPQLVLYLAQAPVLRIDSGDTVVMETMMHSHNQVVPGVTIEAIKKLRTDHPGRGPHTLTGPIYVNGAEPGDVLKVRLNKIVPRAYATNRRIYNRLLLLT